MCRLTWPTWSSSVARVRCVGCRVEIDTRTTGVAEAVRGWRVVRPQGGANQIALMKSQGRWMCAGCLAVLRSGLDMEQGSLF
jgi:ribosomal protein S27E